MYRYTYPVFSVLWRTVRKTCLLLAGLFLFFVAVELARAYELFHAYHPTLGHAFAALVAGGLAWGLLRWFTRRQDRQTLLPPVRPSFTHPRHADLVAYVNYLIHRLKRLSLHPHLEKDALKAVRQRAYDLEGLLGSHPLLEDLTRAIAKAEQETLVPVLAGLDKKAEEIGRNKIRSVIEDSVEPPFPVITPLVVLYHQLTLATTITDVYLGRPDLREYYGVVRDVLRTIRGGDFFRVGQRLFEGVYVNSPPLGRAVDDLGQAITCTWLSWSVTKAAMHRCHSLTPWDEGQAVAWLDEHTAESLAVTRDVLISDVLPLLKLRIRHSAGPGVADAAGFSDAVAQSVARAVENVVKGLSTQDPAKAVQLSRRTQPGLEAQAHPAPGPSAGHPGPWQGNGVLGTLRTVTERMRYSTAREKTP